MTLRVEDCVGKWVRFTQTDSDVVCGYIDRAYVESSKQVYLNTEDNPRCRPDTGWLPLGAPDWADYGWWMGTDSYKDLQLLYDLGKL